MEYSYGLKSSRCCPVKKLFIYIWVPNTYPIAAQLILAALIRAHSLITRVHIGIGACKYMYVYIHMYVNGKSIPKFWPVNT